MTQELFEVTELILFDFACVHIILIFLSKKVLFIVSLKEWEDSLNFVLLEHLWQIKHHHFLVLLSIQFEHLFEKDFNRLIGVELHSESE